MIGAQMVTAARGWLGTPYVHQAATRQVGCDCLGLLRGLWREVLGAEPAPVPPYTADWDEVRRDEVLWQAARRHLHPKDRGDAAPGDVLLFRMRAGAVAKHLALQSNTGAQPAFIHAYSGHGVVESRLTAGWQRRIVARFCFPERI